MIIRKYTQGTVTQVFRDGECISQYFNAGDIVEYEEEDDANMWIVDPKDIPLGLYHPFNMENPVG